jgi:hypothetical protein
MKFTEEGLIIDRKLSDLDMFTIDFIQILRKHTQYVLISGYVAILLGRARVSEDIDIIIPRLPETGCNSLHQELVKNGFYCINTDDPYSYLNEKTAVRYAKKSTVIPNIELKFAKTEIDNMALATAIKAEVGDTVLRISQLEMQIAFKESVLMSPKDIEDARHLRLVAKGHLDEVLINRYKRDLRGI